MEILFIRQILEFLKIKIDFPITVYCDNVGAIFLGHNAKNSQRTKHVDIRHHYVRQYVEDGTVKIIFVKSEDNASDVHTKNTTGAIFKKHALRGLSNMNEK